MKLEERWHAPKKYWHFVLNHVREETGSIIDAGYGISKY